MTDARETGPGAGGPPRRRKAAPLAVAGVAVVAAAALGLYAIVPRAGKPVAHTGACARSLDLARAIDPLAHGDVAALLTAQAPNDLRAVAFDTADGHATSVGAFAGKTILLNLWATWCVPCRAEMPALDKLESSLGSPHFAVVAVNLDQTRLERPRAFLQEIGATHLPYYSDKSDDILQALHGKGLPTTVLIGPDGCEIGTMAGPASWDSQDAEALIARVARPQQGA